ncbi:MAG: response regulator [Acidimicrobiales bacterium]
MSAVVLVVDDDIDVRQTTADILAAAGYDVLEAEDGLVALKILSTTTVDVMVLDVRMPRCNGMEVLRRIDAPPPVVLLLSAYESSTDVRTEAGSKVKRFLRKPLPPQSLLNAVAEAASQQAST